MPCATNLPLQHQRRTGRHLAVVRCTKLAQLRSSRVTESSDTSETPAKPQDYVGLRTELATLVDDFTLVINERWPRLEDHEYRWELHSYGLPEGYDKLVVSDIINLVIGALRGIGATDNKLLRPTLRPTTTIPATPTPTDATVIPQCLTSRSAE
jgi:hypothetical protein